MKILLECERGGEFYSVSRVRSAIHGSGLQVPAASRLVRTISFGIPWGLAFGCIIKENKLLQVSLWCQLSCVIDVCTNTAECQSSARIAQNRREINGTVCCEFSSANIWYKCFASVHFRSVKDFEKNAQSVAVCACPHFKCTTVIDVYDPCFLNSDWFSPKPLSQWGSFSGLVVSLTSSKPVPVLRKYSDWLRETIHSFGLWDRSFDWLALWLRIFHCHSPVALEQSHISSNWHSLLIR